MNEEYTAKLVGFTDDVIDGAHEDFNKEQIKQRDIGWKSKPKIIDYIEVAAAIRRANYVFKGCWNFEILEVIQYRPPEQRMKQLIVRGKVTIPVNNESNVYKEDYGIKDILYKRDTTDEIPLNYGNDLKAATGDCIKRCLRQFGIGNHLYTEVIDDHNEDETTGNDYTGNDKLSTKKEDVSKPSPEQLSKFKRMFAILGLKKAEKPLFNTYIEQWGTNGEKTTADLNRDNFDQFSTWMIGKVIKPLSTILKELNYNSVLEMDSYISYWEGNDGKDREHKTFVDIPVSKLSDFFKSVDSAREAESK